MTKTGSKPSKDRSRGKILFAGVLFALALLGLWARAYFVQVVKGPEYAKMANRQYWASETVSGKRGEIFDRNGLLLAKTIATPSVYVRPNEVKDVWEVSHRLGSILGMSPKSLAAMLGPKKRFVWVARKISDAQAEAVKAEMLPGVYLETENSRQYPQGHMAGQLLGFVNIDGRGIEGLENSFNDLLMPSSTKYTVQKDAAGKRLSSLESGDRSSFNGQDLRLTLDSQVQLATEEALERSVIRAKGKSGMALVVEVPTGEILAWGHYPFFNPNAVKKTRGEWKNRMAVDIFEPGSTMKPIMVAAALQEKVCTPTKEYYCENGKWSVKGRRVKDTHKYENLTVSKIIRYSSNIGAAKIGLELGAAKFHSYLQELGFGRRIGLPLPGESAGLLNPVHQWKDVELANISFGQGLGVTMLQMADAYLCIANGGVRQPLRLVHEAGRPVEGKRIFDSDVARMVMAMLEEVVQEDGTGTQARIEGVRVAGKTGTAQKASPTGGYGGGYVASFVAIFPADKPRYLVCMMVDEPKAGHYGGVLVAPEVRNIGVQLLNSSGMLAEPVETMQMAKVSPERFWAPVQRMENISVDQEFMPDLQGATVREALEILVARGIVPVVKGQGVIIDKQKPLPGEKWPADKKCQLWLTGQAG
ncbi:penicillin-binding transpeptidase domain-containing protein [Desulfomicrobium sp. ZS1]|uniref:penicillin-binding transpeptidase domain-containing protein n=1 Tax=Desulfomicrobium sp. ZS1 TaxID=2952228 RepID=UPI0020B3B2D8|nr:penicillin-binding transpeptidase domain-containing protein [Desulfomicrobium sp. ZS1]UTF49470.1 penicillin-binding transpeptidase domain-containing protein [Desulfomicrobium sp. ZS1]